MLQRFSIHSTFRNSRGVSISLGGVAAALKPYFDAKHYRAATSEVFRSDKDAIEHYLRKGEAKRVWPTPWFDVTWYARENPDARKHRGGIFHHFITVGSQKGLAPNAAHFTPKSWRLPPIAEPMVNDWRAIPREQLRDFFDFDWYYKQTPELHPFDGDPLAHWFRYGCKKDRWPHPLFDTRWYKSQYHHHLQGGKNPLLHYIEEGRRLGFKPNSSGRLPLAWRQLNEVALGTFGSGFCLSNLRNFTTEQFFPPPLPETANLSLPVVPQNTRVLTLDVWDTLLRRDCHPDEIKVASARYLIWLHGDKLKPAFKSLGSCYRARVEAEKLASPKKDYEFRLEAANTYWLHLVLLEAYQSPPHLAAIARELLEYEVATECRRSHKDQAMANWLEAANLQLAFISDFYMSSGALRHIMRKAGINEEVFCNGFASCEVGLNKRSGELFDHVLASLEASPEEVFHVGDNATADKQMPESKNIPAALYCVPEQEARKEWYSKAMHGLINGDANLHLERIAGIAERTAQSIETRDDMSSPLQALGARLAPLFVGFVLDIAEAAIREKSDRVWFFTREGTFFKDVYDRLSSLSVYGLSAPPSQMLEVSRRSTFAASLEACDEFALRRLWSQYGSQSPKGLALSLCLDEQTVKRRCEALDISYDSPISNPARSPTMQRLLSDRAFAAHANQRLKDCRNLLLSYLKKVGFLKPDHLSHQIVDIGWRGTIQDNLAKLTQSHIHGHYLGLFFYLNPQSANATKTGYAFDENSGFAFNGIQEIAPLELVCNGLGGSVVTYERLDRDVTAVRDVIQSEEKSILETSLPIQRGVLAATDEIISYVDKHALAANDLRPLASALAQAVLNDPPSVLADAFFALEHNETFGTGNVERMQGPDSLRSVLQQVDNSEDPASAHYHLDALVRHRRWHNGFVRQSVVSSYLDESKRTSMQIPVEFAIPHFLSPTPFRTPICIICPAPIRGSGGHRTFCNFAKRLAELGFPVELILEREGDGIEIFENFLGDSRCGISVGWKAYRGFQAAIATTPESALFMDNSLSHIPHKFYFVQDFEAAFNPLGASWVAAERSYQLGFTCLTIGTWLTHLLTSSYGAEAYPSGRGLGHDADVYNCKHSYDRGNTISILYQPEKPRRATELVLDAVTLIHQAAPDATFIFYGSKKPINLKFPLQHLKLVESPKALADVYRRSRVSLCLSLSNPSRIPFEAMACGAVPVDLFRTNCLFDYAENTAVLAYQDAQSIAEATLHLLNNNAFFASRQQSCLRFSEPRSMKWEMDGLLNTVMGQISGRRFVCNKPTQSYSEPPVIASGPHRRAAELFCRAQSRSAASL